LSPEGKSRDGWPYVLLGIALLLLAPVSFAGTLAECDRAGCSAFEDVWFAVGNVLGFALLVAGICVLAYGVDLLTRRPKDR
jgi:drug/metabolite transporter (DMT)-like permease